MEMLTTCLSGLGAILGYTVVVVLCLVGVVLSCLSISGTWLVVAAAALAAFLSGAEFPGLWSVVIFAVVSLLVEVAEAVSGAWGVKKRGGSALAGLGALLGGFAGLFVGAAVIPIPIVGSLIGMVAVSFIVVYAIERYRLKHAQKAASIAWGTVIGRVLMILLKVCATLGMIAALALGSAFL